jgi:hypothetical protein
MNPREAHLLSPYRPPTSYPVSLNPDEAEAWLNGYFALWHPAALAPLTRPPQSSSTYDHDTPNEGFLYAVAAGPQLYQPDDWPDRVRERGAVWFTATADRAETLGRCLEGLRTDGRPEALLAAPPEIVRLFAALGFGYLLVESLFDAMDHEHLLDAEGFWADVQAAIQALTSPETQPTIRDHLKAAAQKLDVARQSLNSNPIRIFDLALLVRDKLSTNWPGSLKAGLPVNVLASGEVLETLRDHSPERFAELQSRFAPGLPSTVTLCCGAYRERDDALLPLESQMWNLQKARAVVRQIFETEAEIYARQCSALHPHLPSWLLHVGFKNAVVVTFDGSLAPTRNAAVLSWPAPDGKSMDCYSREPLNASDPLTFFNLVYHLHQAITQDSTPAIGFKHTGDPAAVGYAELIDLAELGDVVGEWSSLARFLGEHHYGDYMGSTTADDYFADALDDRVSVQHRREPISGFARHARLRRKLDSAFALAALHRSLSPIAEDDAGLLAKLDRAEDEIETRGPDTESPLAEASESDVEVVEGAFARKLADRIQVRAAEGQPGYLVFNPCNFTRRVALELDDFGGPIPVADPVKAAEFSGRSARLVVEVPSLGFAWFPRPSGGVAPPKPRLKTAEGAIVRNEFIEAEFDPSTGALRAFRDLRLRTNRLGMQMIFNPGSKTRAKSIAVTNAGTALGEVVCEGEILDEQDAVLATFRNRMRAWVGRPALELRIEIDPKHTPTGYPWHAYYAARFACRDDRAAVFRGVNGANLQSTYTRPVSPDYLEFRLGSERSFLFTGGLPFIQKHGTRMADVVLVCEGEQARTFDLLLACDRDYPMQTAAGWTAPAPLVATTKGPPHIGPSGWLGHVDLPSLLLTQLRPATATGEGMTKAVTARLLECAGFGGASEIRFARDPARALLVDGEGRDLHPISMVEGGIPVDFSANEAFRIRAEWA